MTKDFQAGKQKLTTDVMLDELTPEAVREWMKSSFYLPHDVLSDSNWDVSPIRVKSQKDFRIWVKNIPGTVRYVEHISLVGNANLVAISSRVDKATGKQHHILKIWYGDAPK